jgi:hypothetical protein
MMDEKKRFVRCQEMLEADVNGEIVALHLDRGQCYGMNGVASEIWRMLSEPASIEEIAAELAGVYEVDSATCRSEVGRLLAQLKEEGLVKEL